MTDIKQKTKARFTTENMVLGIHIPAVRKLTFEEVNRLITKSKIGFWEILREETSTPMIKLKAEINEHSVCALLWINSNKIQFMGIKRKEDAADCYNSIIQDLSKFVGFLKQ